MPIKFLNDRYINVLILLDIEILSYFLNDQYSWVKGFIIKKSTSLRNKNVYNLLECGLDVIYYYYLNTN